MDKTRVIAFYLPQFHEIPENNQWWGDGFTEWTNTTKAKPLFPGHYQPHIPLDHNYYDLTDDKVFDWQISLAKKYGVDGFCFYHYWFKDGRKLLEKPVESYLANSSLNHPFCISWANEPWSRRWDGLDREVLMEQDYGTRSDWIDHFEYLLPFFKDPRYINIGGKPLVVLYKPDQIPCVVEMIECWKELAVANSLNGLYLAWQFPTFLVDDYGLGKNFDMFIEFEPFFSMRRRCLLKSPLSRIGSFLATLVRTPNIALGKLALRANTLLDYFLPSNPELRLPATNIYSYRELSSISTSLPVINHKFAPGAFPSWDNTARRGSNATLISGSSPATFHAYLAKQLERANSSQSSGFLFINAWNEWAEGAHLEPDEKFKYGYLEALASARHSQESKPVKLLRAL